MVCKNCGLNKARLEEKKVTIAGLVNRVLSFFCIKCGNLMYGSVSVVK